MYSPCLMNFIVPFLKLSVPLYSTLQKLRFCERQACQRLLRAYIVRVFPYFVLYTSGLFQYLFKTCTASCQDLFRIDSGLVHDLFRTSSVFVQYVDITIARLQIPFIFPTTAIDIPYIFPLNAFYNLRHSELTTRPLLHVEFDSAAENIIILQPERKKYEQRLSIKQS